MRRAAPVTHVKRTGKGAGREIFGIHELQTESFQFRLKSCFSQNTLTISYVFRLLTYKPGYGRPKGIFKFMQSNLLH